MGASVKVKIEDSSGAWLQQEEIRVGRGLRRMAQDAVNIAKLTAPMKVGNLRDSGHVEGMGLQVKAVFGDSSVRYAAVQEKKQFSHYTTPGTGPKYLKNGGDAAVQKGIKTYL